MKISRNGATADHGTRSVNLPEPKFSWNSTDKTVHIKHTAAADFATSANHRYDVMLSPSDLKQLLTVLADVAMKDPSAFESTLASSVRPLSQLVAVASGIVKS